MLERPIDKNNVLTINDQSIHVTDKRHYSNHEEFDNNPRTQVLME